MSRAAFLFGSGISIPSGTPSVQEITRALLKLGWRERGKFRFTPSDAESAGTTKLAQEFLRVLKTFLDPHLKIRLNRECNYEDLFAAASQILCDEAGDIVDPMLCESVRAIRNSVSHLCSASEIEGRSDPFLSLVEQAALFVHAGVFHLIGTATRPLGMDALVAVARYTEQMDIFTVNHDLLIETLFDENGVRFSDGYSKKAGPVRRFNWSWKNGPPVRIFKLHGSIDYFPYHFPDTSRQFAKVPRNVLLPNYNADVGNGLHLDNALPLLLIGTIGKERRYGVGILNEFLLEFDRRLNKCRTVISCGYGWGDRGINSKLQQWIHYSPTHRLVVLHHGPQEKLLVKYFWSNRDNGRRLEQNHKVIHLSKWLCECTIDDLKPFLDD